ncbi:peptidoglycan-binding protein [Flexivirga caeni]|uniref:peptidoglycan-binding protein n=1 Tax=Flexivirga caeni TaxID=2294115 RepID=UPI001315582C|nr:peptidoglycan-binding protein [Flexivirga caeni]
MGARAAALMGQELVSFAINGDAGSTYPAGTVCTEACTASPGDIVISHMNRPGGGTAPGYARKVPALKARGYKFRTLSQVIGATTSPPTSWVTIEYGSQGAEAVGVQRVLHLTADGIFGPITQAAVKAYQGSHHSVPDGIVGPLTAHTMGLA